MFDSFEHGALVHQVQWARENGVTPQGDPDFIALVKVINGNRIPVMSGLRVLVCLFFAGVFEARACHEEARINKDLHRTHAAHLTRVCLPFPQP